MQCVENVMVESIKVEIDAFVSALFDMDGI